MILLPAGPEMNYGCYSRFQRLQLEKENAIILSAYHIASLMKVCKLVVHANSLQNNHRIQYLYLFICNLGLTQLQLLW